MKKTDYLYQNENLMTETQKKYMYEIYINHNGNSLQNIEYLAKSFRLTKENFLQIISNYVAKNIILNNEKYRSYWSRNNG